MKSLNIFVLLSFGNSISKSLKLLEGLIDSVLECFAPGESSSDWWIVVVDWGSFIIFLNENLSLQEYGLDIL